MSKIDRSEDNIFPWPKVAYIRNNSYVYINTSNRYIHWIMDEIGRNSRLYTYKYKNEPVGFSCMKEARPNVYYPILGGVYLLEKTLPIGSALIYKQLEIVKSLEGKELYTFISSNNPAVIKSYSQLGYIFGDIKYVFIKHVDCCE